MDELTESDLASLVRPDAHGFVLTMNRPQLGIMPVRDAPEPERDGRNEGERTQTKPAVKNESEQRD